MAVSIDSGAWSCGGKQTLVVMLFCYIMNHRYLRQIYFAGAEKVLSEQISREKIENIFKIISPHNSVNAFKISIKV